LCVERLTELAGLGVDHFVANPPGFGTEAADQVRARIAAEIIPAVKAATRT
jgi:hypothetical protein